MGWDFDELDQLEAAQESLEIVGCVSTASIIVDDHEAEHLDGDSLSTDDEEQLAPGDFVELFGHSVASEFRGRTAVVTEVHEVHFTATVLDSKHQGIGQCWPNISDARLQHRSWRVGERVTVSGMRSQQRKSLNGASGEVIRHPREGHPCFISRSNAAGPQLTLCIRLDERWQGKRTILLEPQYLATSSALLRKATADLADVVFTLGSSIRPEPEAELSPAPSIA
jgi:hypothetical protein